MHSNEEKKKKPKMSVSRIHKISPALEGVRDLMEDEQMGAFVREYLLHPGYTEATLMFLAFYSELQRLLPTASPHARILLLDKAIKNSKTRSNMVRVWKESGQCLSSIQHELDLRKLPGLPSIRS